MLIIIAALGVVIYTLLQKPKEQKTTVNRAVSEGLVVDDNIDRKASEARFTTDMNMIWTFPSGNAVSNNAQILQVIFMNVILKFILMMRNKPCFIVLQYCL